jgi:short-subunit dehydrogenase
MNVFLTGASSGIGEALARHYAHEGATLGLLARRPEVLARLAAELAPAQVTSYAVDVRDAAALAAAAADFIAQFGLPDIVIANAGISQGTLTDAPGDELAFRNVLETNVLGMVHTFAPFVAAMRRRGSGILVGVASVAGFRGIPGSGAYSASKAAAISYLESLRVELTGSGVAVVTICPGFVATPMTGKNPYPMPFLLQPATAAARIARAIAAKRRFCVVPWQMGVVGRVLRCLPRPIYDAAFARAPRKPRQSG